MCENIYRNLSTTCNETERGLIYKTVFDAIMAFRFNYKLIHITHGHSLVQTITLRLLKSDHRIHRADNHIRLPSEYVIYKKFRVMRMRLGYVEWILCNDSSGGRGGQHSQRIVKCVTITCICLGQDGIYHLGLDVMWLCDPNIC